jgi:hypothetical protein
MNSSVNIETHMAREFRDTAPRRVDPLPNFQPNLIELRCNGTDLAPSEID